MRKLSITAIYLALMIVYIPKTLSFVKSQINGTTDNVNAKCIYGKTTSKEESIYDMSRKAANRENAKSLMSMLKVEHIDIAMAQMILESGHFKSRLSRTNNNFFGMKMPRKRNTTAIRSKNGYACYDNWTSSVQDYYLWQRKYARGLTRKEFLVKISSYSEDNNYICKIESLIRRYHL